MSELEPASYFPTAEEYSKIHADYDAQAILQLHRFLKPDEQMFLYALDNKAHPDLGSSIADAIEFVYEETGIPPNLERAYMKVLEHILKPIGGINAVDESKTMLLLSGTRHAIRNNGDLVERMQDYSNHPPFDDNDYLRFVQYVIDC